MCETDRCDKWSWRLSRYDDRVHAFVSHERPASFVEAACTHSVPIDKIMKSHAGSRCVACLLIVGDHLAQHHQLGAGI
ncbi:hypothetical protein [Actinophytocola sp.]|uniref:hypothetical protein n=1 Tax=Actinophytocola sp. TaxID=1872138 RepID=UPI003D6C32DE